MMLQKIIRNKVAMSCYLAQKYFECYINLSTNVLFHICYTINFYVDENMLFFCILCSTGCKITIMTRLLRRYMIYEATPHMVTKIFFFIHF